jgi:modulator of FtsH protease HflC
MTAYETGLRNSDTRFLLRPDSDFFRYFGSAAGKQATSNGSSAPPAAVSATPAASPPAPKQ